MSHVVTVFLRNRAEILLTRRSEEVGTYQDRWAGVSGYVEGDSADAEQDARRELREEVGVTDATLVRAGDPLDLQDDGREWTVHPFLFDVAHREIEPNWELADTEWTSPTAIMKRETVPALWETYQRVAPTVETIAADAEHGSAYLSIRALEVLRDRAAVAVRDGDVWDDIAATARELCAARESMAALRNRVNRVMDRAEVGAESGSAQTVHEQALAVLREVLDADDQTAANAADLLRDVDGAVLTLSRSGTVDQALRRADSPVVIAESRPAREGVEVATELAEAGLAVTLMADAAMAFALADGDDAPEIGAALVGADTVLSDGRVVNKVGTRALCLACAREEVPCYVAATSDKISPDDEVHLEFGDATDLYKDEQDVDVWNPIFDVTPVECLDGFITEDGLLDSDEVVDLAGIHRQWAAWDE